jgi:hypothetical protein
MSDESTGTDMDDQAQRQDPQDEGKEAASGGDLPEIGSEDRPTSDAATTAAAEVSEPSPPADETTSTAASDDTAPAADSASAGDEADAHLGVGPEVELDEEEPAPAQAQPEASDGATDEASDEGPEAGASDEQASSGAVGGFEPVQPGASLAADELGLDEDDSAAADFTDHAVMEILSDCIHMASQPPPPVSTEDDAQAEGDTAANVALPPPPGAPRIDMLDADDEDDEDDEDDAARYGVSSSAAPVTLPRSSKPRAKVDIVPPTTEPTGPGWPTVVVGTIAASVLTLALGWGALSSGVLSPPDPDEQQKQEPAGASEPAADVDPNEEQVAEPGAGLVGEPASRAPAGEQPSRGEGTEQTEPQSAQIPETADTAGPFNRNAAAEALGNATTRAERCSYPPTRQSGRVSVTFTNDGRATKVYVLPGPFAGSPAAWCIAQVFRSVKLAPFEGEPVTLLKRITLNPLPKASGQAAPKAAKAADKNATTPPSTL